MIHDVSVSIVNTSIHPLSIMYPYPLSCLDYASISMDPWNPPVVVAVVVAVFVVALLE